MKEFCAVVSVVSNGRLKVYVEAETEQDAIDLISNGDWDDCMDEAYDIYEIKEIELY